MSLIRIHEAVEIAGRAVAKAPDLGVAHALAGAVHFKRGEVPEAVASYERATALDGDLAVAWSGLGQSLSLAGRLNEAVVALRKAVALQPSEAQSWCGLLAALASLHLFADVRAVAAQARQQFSGAVGVDVNALFASNADPARTAEEVFAEHKACGERLAASEATKRRPHPNSRAPERRLRIGYLSPDFRVHSVAFFMAPVVATHDRGQFDVFCYFNSWSADRTTEFFRAHATAWRDVAALSDDALARQIREDQIDILVDLAGYTNGCRMMVFAQKPAPVQVAYLGYPNTTGLPTMDYRITDAVADPEGLSEALHTEELVRPFSTFLCYVPAANAPQVTDAPAESSGAITFGSFNDYRKMSDELIELWSAVVRDVPGSRMVIKTKPLVDPTCRAQVREAFQRHGIHEDRIELLPADPAGTQHLARYASVDIALDTFPYHGTTTTCEAMWMGVPVVTLAGESHRSRVGASLLHNVGLAELVGRTPEDFVRRAAALAQDAGRRRHLRAGLRGMMRRSPLMDADGFTRALEGSYRQMWRRWCEETAG